MQSDDFNREVTLFLTRLLVLFMKKNSLLFVVFKYAFTYIDNFFQFSELTKLSDESLARPPDEVFDIICKIGRG